MANLAGILGDSFNPADVEEVQTNFEPLPKGNYSVEIIEDEIAPTKAGNGDMLTLKLKVTGGQFNGRILFDMLCIRHINETAQRIAQTKLKKICDALAITKLIDTMQLHNKPLVAEVKVEIDQYQTDKTGEKTFRNSIVGYHSAGLQKGHSEPAKPKNSPELVNEDIPF